MQTTIKTHSHNGAIYQLDHIDTKTNRVLYSRKISTFGGERATRQAWHEIAELAKANEWQLDQQQEAPSVPQTVDYTYGLAIITDPGEDVRTYSGPNEAWLDFYSLQSDPQTVSLDLRKTVSLYPFEPIQPLAVWIRPEETQEEVA